MQARVAEYSWDRTAATIAAAIDAVLDVPARPDEAISETADTEQRRAAAA